MSPVTYERLSRLQEIAARTVRSWAAKSAVESVAFNGEGYAEPGYDPPKSGWIALGNWNSDSRWDAAIGDSVIVDNTMPRLARILERLGVDLEWSDEWTDCSGCYKLVRTQPNGYDWMKSWAEIDGDTLCVECLVDDPTELLESLEGKHNSALTINDIKPNKHGYQKLDGKFENGFHFGQADDPKEIARSLRALGVSRFLFQIDSVGQFDLDFSVWVHESEAGKVTPEAWEKAKKTADVSPSELLRQGLLAAAATPPPKGEGIVYTQIAGGQATTRLISPQEWIEGIKDKMGYEKKQLLIDYHTSTHQAQGLVGRTIAQVTIDDDEIGLRFEDGDFVWLASKVDDSDFPALVDHKPAPYELELLGVISPSELDEIERQEKEKLDQETQAQEILRLREARRTVAELGKKYKGI